ncbi:PAS domain-containing hybrid sensor histidine kinase/response regulator [Ulvibacter litoralis]|uniref:histidine kinase n=1 Tax=Ulvibacter litoralis TaxID=227084 RepID=A0A1G7HQJ5_9FLAO|nr:PAS domain-containing hybrid sensor histidine kinase/response regulator [Ulvibacter litoralis]GHC58654.1 hypothetical protein GCM10008083_24340 [Ulvibacter litoralis]SDF02544.1 His Kinase A (phospho-acceptor) domain-containing protein [Ulvibacter litoralis]
MTKKKETDSENISRMKAALDLYDNAPCGSVSFRKDGMIFDLNTTLSNWLGYNKNEIINKITLPSLFKIGGQIFFETHFFPLIQMQGFIKEVYFDILKKDKTILHGLINVREIPESDDQPVTYQATILDISDRWHFESALLKAKQKAEADSKAKAEFLSTISHEIRTPLNSILGIGNLLHKTPLNKNQKEYARLLLHSSEHLLSLVNNLLDLSKIEAKKIILERVDFNLYDLTTILQQTFSVKAKEKGIDLIVNIEKEVPMYLIGDHVKLNQILTNLIGNAIKFTKQGSVSLSISATNVNQSEVRLDFTVSDTGIGIPKEKLESIFQEFSQASYDVSVEFGGTGLGLTISKKLLELHNSTLTVTSELNVGSNFNFSIEYPKSENINSKKDISLLITEEHSFSSYHVLLVDDNPDNIFIAEQYLNQWDVEYKSAESGLQALTLLEKHNFDLILLDLQMPYMNGYETAKKVREMSLDKSPIIIAFSASTKGEVKEQLKEAGINDHLPKPFQPKELYEILLRYHHTSHNNKITTSPLEIKTVKKKTTEKNNVKPVSKKTESFNLARFEKMANNKPEYLKKFRLSTLDAIISYQKDFQKAITERKVAKLSELIHKSTMSLYYIAAEPLSELLKECRLILAEDSKNETLLTAKVNECNNEFTCIINGLREA